MSFDTPEYTANSDALGTLRLLEAIRILEMNDRVRFYQASTSELYGNASVSPQNEDTPFKPVSPYGTAKLYSYWITMNYRDSYGMYATNGILFNHESPKRGETFVTRKITRAVASIALGKQKQIYLGNLEAKRDCGHAKDYVEGMWLMLQQQQPDNYVLATGQSKSVREFVEAAFLKINIEIIWQGKGIEEKGVDKSTGNTLVSVDPVYYRPNELHELCGDASKALSKLGWSPTCNFQDLVSEMVSNDLIELKK